MIEYGITLLLAISSRFGRAHNVMRSWRAMEDVKKPLGPVSKGPNSYLASRPKIRGLLLGVPRIRIIVLGGLYWGPCILGNYHPICAWEPQENYGLNTWANLVSCLKACGSRLREAAQAASTVADAASAGEAPRSGLSSYSGPPSFYT